MQEADSSQNLGFSIYRAIRMRPLELTALVLALLLAFFVAAPAQAELSFNREVRPLLSGHCFKCHGPDEDERQADLRLDVPGDEATGEVDYAEVLRRIESTDPDEQMPPPEANKPLTAANIATLREWIAEGAPYERHWAFVKPRKPEVPTDQHPVDAFVNAKLAEAGIEPAGRAEAYTLVRRLYLDLVGLPPTLAEADAFAADPSDTAYRAMVDRLLASPRYGERWARRWLDLARYADTNGYEKDRDRSIWPYRDWVIRALNSDMPFDQFTVEQLAGDMLPEATPEQVVATGFHRNTMLNEEGGIDPQEFRFHAMTDRVATTGTTWLGLTVGCAQCHTHKYDPITHTDYFGMFAYLNNTDEPDLVLPDDAAEAAHRKNLAEAEALVAELPQHWPGGEVAFDEAFAKWLQTERDRLVDWRPLVPTALSANVPYLVNEGDGVIFAGGDTSKHDIYQITLAPSQTPIAALRLEALPDERLPGGGPGTTFYEGRKGDFFLTELKIENANVASASDSYALNEFKNKPAAAMLAVDGDIQSGWSVSRRSGERHVAVFAFDQPLPGDKPLDIEMHFGRHFASSLGKFRFSAATDARAVANDFTPTELALIARPAEELSAAELAILRETFALRATELEEHTKRIAELRAPAEHPETLVMRERPAEHPRPTFLHHRGEYTQPTVEVSPQLPEALLASGEALPQTRLEFAQWLVDDENPLTARVVANRHWAALFGTGIVSTVDDFGMQGEPPTHPQLLDHLARFLVDNDWSIKQLHRHLVTSETYQRSSQFTTESDNRLLARFPRQRLEAEIIRDAALQASGLLHEEMFGPPVRPPQPGGITEVAYSGSKWEPSEAPDRYRRSIYAYQKRTAPFAMFTTFDASSGESCLARRDRSNTPLQALTLLNDPMFIEIAEAFGKAIAESSGEVEEKITKAFRHALTRPPTAAELQRLREFHEQHASWAALARALLSLDEAVTKN